MMLDSNHADACLFDGQSLPQVFKAGLARYARLTSTISGERRLDFATVDRLSDAVAASLARSGIRKGDRVGLYGINSDGFVLAYLGILKAGGVIVPINLLLNPHEIAFILNDAEVRALVYFEAFAAAVSVFRNDVATLKTLICAGSHPSQPGDTLWDSVIAEPAAAPTLQLDPAEDLAAILYTSGTTGRPKGAMLTHRNLVCNTWSVQQALRLEPGKETLIVVLPMFHAFAATACMLTPLLYGGTIVALPKFDPVQVAHAIQKEKATLFLGVPSMFVALLRLPPAHTGCFESLRYCISGGAALPVAVMQQFEARFGKVIYEGDGPTECSPVTCVNPIGGERKPGTVGRPVPLVSMAIKTDEGQDLPQGQIGEICVRGPNVMKGYWQLPEDTRESFFGDWFRTGDLGNVDADGYFSILDRKKDMIIVNGMNIYPRIIEEVLSRHPAVREAAVVGEPNAVHGEIPVAFVTIKDGAAAAADELRAFCRESLGRHEIPRKVTVLPELPKNASGKILKRELRKHGEVERGIAHG